MGDKWTKIGAFWKKRSKSGKAFLAGEITIDGVKTKITCWPNDKAGNEKRPDYVIYRDDYKPASQDDGGAEGDEDSDGLPF